MFDGISQRSLDTIARINADNFDELLDVRRLYSVEKLRTRKTTLKLSSHTLRRDEMKWQRVPSRCDFQMRSIPLTLSASLATSQNKFMTLDHFYHLNFLFGCK